MGQETTVVSQGSSESMLSWRIFKFLASLSHVQLNFIYLKAKESNRRCNPGATV